jgi:hypothetical protein
VLHKVRQPTKFSGFVARSNPEPDSDRGGSKSRKPGGGDDEAIGQSLCFKVHRVIVADCVPRAGRTCDTILGWIFRFGRVGLFGNR